MAYLAIASDEWVQRAVCGDSDSDLWISDLRPDQEKAKDICAGCPVMMDCLEWAIRNNETGGIWGGLGPSERKEYKSRRARWSQGLDSYR